MNTFDDKLAKYLSIPESERDVAEGAMMLLQLNKNKILYTNIIRRPEGMAPKLFYELDKIAKIRAIKSNDEVLAELTEKTSTIKKELDKVGDNSGKREDHDELPAEIQQLYVDNAPLLAELRGLHEKAKVVESECDRIETLTLLKEQFEKYRDNWNRYDSYSIENGAPVEVDEKRVSTNRAYISKNKGKLKELMENPEAKSEYDALLSKVQERVDELKEAEATMTDTLTAELEELGVIF